MNNSNNSSLINEFDLQRLRELGQQKSKLKRKIDNKLQILSLLPSDGYEKVIVNVNKTLVEELISENENYKFEIEHLSDKINRLKKENRDKKPKNKELLKSRKEEKKKSLTEAPIPTNLTKNLFNCFNYNEYNEDGSRKIILKRDLYNQNFYMMYRTVMQSAAFPSWNEFNSFIYKWKLQDFDNILVTTLTGPEDSSSNDLTYGNYASCAAISLYPHCPGRPYREGDPICDRFQVALFINRILVCLTDGCNWGDKPRKASRIANKTIINYMKENIDKVKNIQSAIFTLLAAISDAQITIIDGSEEWTPGTTTVSCGLLLEIDQDFVENNFLLDSEVEQEQQMKEQIILAPTKWVFVSANLGDCKILHISILDRLKVNDITGISRSNSTDLTDPGGRLGSHLDGWPDLRNLAVNFTAVNEGDIIAVMSDGVHDNLDPQTLGYSPRNFDIDYDDWEKAPEHIVAQVKKLYLAKAIEQLLQDEEFISPKVVKDKLINHCLNVTTKSRNFLSENPTLKVPGNYAQYPGKLDHSSIVCFRVGRTNRLSKKGSSGPLFDKKRNVIIRPSNRSKLDIFASIKEELRIGQEKKQISEGEPKILPFRNIALGRMGSSPIGWTAARKPSADKEYDFGATL